MSEQPTAAVRVERSHKRARPYLGGDLVADTRAPLLVWEHDNYPAYYIPAADVTADLIPAGQTDRLPRLGEAELLHVKTPTTTVDAAARRFPDAPVAVLRDAIRLDWAAMSEWLEEDEPVYVHPRDPYKRVDILASSRRVRVELDGVTVADSSQPRVLFETGLPPRYYLPLADLRMDLLRPSDTITRCPYKGSAGTGRSTPVPWRRRAGCTPTSSGCTGARCPRARRSRAWPASTTSASIFTWTTSWFPSRRRRSAELVAQRVVKHAQDVAARELGAIRPAPASVDELGEQRRVARHVAEAIWQIARPVEVAADADMVNAGHIPDVLDVIGDVRDGRGRHRVGAHPVV